MFVAVASEDEVITGATADGVVAAEPLDHIGAARPQDHVVTLGPDARVAFVQIDRDRQTVTGVRLDEHSIARPVTRQNPNPGGLGDMGLSWLQQVQRARPPCRHRKINGDWTLAGEDRGVDDVGENAVEQHVSVVPVSDACFEHQDSVRIKPDNGGFRPADQRHRRQVDLHRLVQSQTVDLGVFDPSQLPATEGPLSSVLPSLRTEAI